MSAKRGGNQYVAKKQAVFLPRFICPARDVEKCEHRGECGGIAGRDVGADDHKDGGDPIVTYVAGRMFARASRIFWAHPSRTRRLLVGTTKIENGFPARFCWA